MARGSARSFGGLHPVQDSQQPSLETLWHLPPAMENRTEFGGIYPHQVANFTVHRSHLRNTPP